MSPIEDATNKINNRSDQPASQFYIFFSDHLLAVWSHIPPALSQLALSVDSGLRHIVLADAWQMLLF
jgi:hypothetical protein